MSWWLIMIAAFVLLRATRRQRWERRPFGGWRGEFPGRPDWTRGRSLGGIGERTGVPAPPPAPVPDPRRDLERTIAAVRDAYVAGRITVEEYEGKLDELYRTAEGKRLRES